MYEGIPRGFDPLFDGPTIITLYEYFEKSGANAHLLSFHTLNSRIDEQKSLDALCRDGLATIMKNGNYILTDAGKDFVREYDSKN